MIRRELKLFLVVGVSTVAVDFVVYQALLWLTVLPSAAKATSFLVGTMFAYFANGHWTFAHRGRAEGSLLRFLLLYSSTLAANVALNALVLRIFADRSWATLLAFLIATATSAILNFIGMKLLVFTSSPKEAST